MARQKPKPRTISQNSQKRLNWTTTISLSDTGKVYEPFFSIAMRCWRIEFCGFLISDYRLQRQSSIFCDEHRDAMVIYEIVKDVKTWETWVDARSEIQAAMEQGTGGHVWRTGIPEINNETFHRQLV